MWLASPRGAAVAFLKSIIYRFGVPSRIITDNGTQFTSRLFQEYEASPILWDSNVIQLLVSGG
jgi:hypothetical protein